MDTPLNILIVEDCPADYRLIARHLQQHGVLANCQCVPDREGLLAAVERGGWDVVLSDYHIPKLDFTEILRLLRERMPDQPLILVSGSLGEERAVELLKLGVWDFVLKDSLARLVPAIQRGLRDAADRRGRREAEAALRASEERFRQMAENVDAVFWMSSPGLREILYVSPAYERIWGRSCASLYAQPSSFLQAVHPEDTPRVLANVQEKKLQNGERYSIEYRIVQPSGEVRWVRDRGFPVRDEAGRLLRMVGIAEDISEQMRLETEKGRLEAQLDQAHKLEAVGRLAGGVAHDFNNMLSVILGYGELAQKKTPPNTPLYRDLGEILAAAGRSRDITRQLLAFARQQVIRPKVLDLNETLESMLKMLQRLVGEDIELLWLPCGCLWPVWMDPSQLDQILANLCVNARDAIADVGRITMHTDNIVVDDVYCAAHADVKPGKYVLLAITDNGCGMAPETLERIFEPFFTTKGPDKGTGLGLSMVYGIVKQNHGFIHVYSEPGQGSTFRLYLPRHATPDDETDKEALHEAPRGRGETILVVEDEAAILRLLQIVLAGLGYNVLAAMTPGDALRLARKHGHVIQLLLTDVVMPQMNGRQLAEQIQSIAPHTKQVFMSGYTADVIASRGVLEHGFHFLHKPFSAQDVATKIRAVLDEPTPSAGNGQGETGSGNGG